MGVYKKKTIFLESDAGIEARRVLQDMATDQAYNTQSSYSANTVQYPDNVRSFVDRHMDYLSNHPTTDPRQYISNLRLMTRKK